MGGPRGHLDDRLHRSGDTPPVLLVTCPVSCVCSAPRCICLDFRLQSPTSLPPTSLPFWEAGLPASVLNLLLPGCREAPSPWLLVLRFGRRLWNECDREGARSRGSPWPGCWQVYRLLSPPLPSLSFPATRPRPFLSPLQAAPPHSPACWSLFLFPGPAARSRASSAGNLLGQTLCGFGARENLCFCSSLLEDALNWGGILDLSSGSRLPFFTVRVLTTYWVADIIPWATVVRDLSFSSSPLAG